MKMRLISCIFVVLLSLQAFALPLPEVGKFKFKTVDERNIIYYEHTGSGHISNTVIKLVQYYLLNDSDDFSVVFPHIGISSDELKNEQYAIAYKGNPPQKDGVKMRTLKGGTFASFIYQGNYRDIGRAIRSTFAKVVKGDEYIPDDSGEIRLLYWNSIDDHHPKDLITEIQIKVMKKF